MKRGKHPTGKRRAKRQQVKERYSKAREDAQLTGLISTEPVGAVRDEKVDPATQSSQQLPALIREALKENWSTPDAAKPAIVGQLLEPFFSHDVVLDKDGNQVRVPPNRGMLIALAKVLKDLDVVQFERDHPELAGKAKGGGVEVNNQVSVIGDLAAILKRAEEQMNGKSLDNPPRPDGDQGDVLAPRPVL